MTARDARFEAMRPLIEVMIAITPDVLAAEAGRKTPDIWDLEVDDLDGTFACLDEVAANTEAVADLLERLGREAGLSRVALCRAADLVSEMIQSASATIEIADLIREVRRGRNDDEAA